MVFFEDLTLFISSVEFHKEFECKYYICVIFLNITAAIFPVDYLK